MGLHDRRHAGNVEGNGESRSMNFDEAFDILIGHEGGYVNNPKDPGGETNWGVSKRSYPKLDIKNLTREGAKVIYRADFWGPLPKAVMATPVAFPLFDLAVNSGPRRAIQILQTTVDTLADGAWGPKSQAAFDKLPALYVAIALSTERLIYMTNLNNWSDASRGWARRIAFNVNLSAKELLK
jgi:lysozyme family protein